MWRKEPSPARQDYYERDQNDSYVSMKRRSLSWLPLLIIPLLLIPLFVFGVASIWNNPKTEEVIKSSTPFQTYTTARKDTTKPQVGIGGAPAVATPTPTPTIVAPVPDENRIIQGIGGSGTLPDSAPSSGRGQETME